MSNSRPDSRSGLSVTTTEDSSTTSSYASTPEHSQPGTPTSQFSDWKYGIAKPESLVSSIDPSLDLQVILTEPNAPAVKALEQTLDKRFIRENLEFLRDLYQTIQLPVGKEYDERMEHVFNTYIGAIQDGKYIMPEQQINFNGVKALAASYDKNNKHIDIAEFSNTISETWVKLINANLATDIPLYTCYKESERMQQTIRQNEVLLNKLATNPKLIQEIKLENAQIAAAIKELDTARQSGKFDKESVKTTIASLEKKSLQAESNHLLRESKIELNALLVLMEEMKIGLGKGVEMEEKNNKTSLSNALTSLFQRKDRGECGRMLSQVKVLEKDVHDMLNVCKQLDKHLKIDKPLEKSNLIPLRNNIQDLSQKIENFQRSPTVTRAQGLIITSKFSLDYDEMLAIAKNSFEQLAKKIENFLGIKSQKNVNQDLDQSFGKDFSEIQTRSRSNANSEEKSPDEFNQETRPRR